MPTDSVLQLSLRPDITLADPSADSLTFQLPLGAPLVLNHLTPGLVAAFKQLASGGATEQQLTALVQECDGPATLFQFHQYLAKFSSQGLICHTLQLADRALATLVPLSRQYRYRSNAVDPTQKYVLSRFAYCHLVEGQLVLESSVGFAKIILEDGQAGRLIAELAHPHDASELVSLIADWPPEATQLFLNFLANAQALTSVTDHQTAEDASPTLGQWEFQDLLFHTRSRIGRHANPVGGTFHSRGKFDPLPLVKPKMSEDIIPLYRPDVEQLKQTDPSLTTVLEQRRSLRDYAEAPITDRELGEFLYRTARIKHVIKSEHDEMEFSLRNYPGGGAVHALEVYPVIGACQNIPAGLYHYDPLEHHLQKVADKNPYVDSLLYLAWITATRRSNPQVCLVITARFQRVQWKYQTVAYALCLKDLGGLYQTMYLVATAMGLAPCALGGGDADLFALAAGLDYYAETSIGEFLLGSKGSASHAGGEY